MFAKYLVNYNLKEKHIDMDVSCFAIHLFISSLESIALCRNILSGTQHEDPVPRGDQGCRTQTCLVRMLAFIKMTYST